MTESDQGCVFPVGVHLSYPIQVFQQSGYTSEMIRIMYSAQCSRAGDSDMIKMILCERTSRFMITASAYRGHVEHWIAMQRWAAHVQSSQLQSTSFVDFPGIFQHCNGFNSTLGPSGTHVTDIINHIIALNQQLFCRMEGAITGSQLSGDHHHNVPRRMQVTDPHNGKRFAPIEGLHTVMNERQQYLSHVFTATVTNSEREPVARDLKRRF